MKRMNTPGASDESLLLRFSSEVMLAVDPRTLRILAASPACARRLLYAGNAFAAMSITDIDVSLQSAIYWAAVSQSAGEPVERVHTQYRRGDGSLVDAVHSVFFSVEDGQDRVIVRCDELADRKSEFAADDGYVRHVNRILESTSEGIMVLDSQRRITSANRRLLAIWGIPRMVAARADSAEMLRFMSGQVILDGRQRAEELIVAPMEEGGADLLHLKSGKTIERRHQLHANPGDPRGAIVTFIDVSSRARTQQTLQSDRDFLADLVAGKIAELREARDEAEAASRAKSDFLAKMSHELRTPLHAILNYARFGESGGTVSVEKLQLYFHRINASGERLLSLVNDLLDLSKSRRGEDLLELAAQDVCPVLQDACEELGVLAHAKGIELRFDCPAAPAIAPIDVLRLGQVARNLIGNAIKFTPVGGQVLVRARREQTGDGAGQVIIEVRDNGPGIPEDQLEDVFREFVQSRHHVNEDGGTGLGLAICREIMAAHGGSIHAANNAGGGAIFTAILPAGLKPDTDLFTRDDEPRGMAVAISGG